jgi:arginine deiminase
LRAEVDNYKQLLVDAHQAIDSLREGRGASPSADAHQLETSRHIMVDQAAELERLRNDHLQNQQALLAAKTKIRELEEFVEVSARTAPQASHTVLEDTVIQYRKEIERLEQVFSNL